MQLALICVILPLLVAAVEYNRVKYSQTAALSYRKRISIQNIFERNNFTIIPDGELEISFNERYGRINPGDRLNPLDTINPPVVSFDSEDGCYYAFMCLKMDYPFTDNPYLSPGLVALYGRVNVDENVGDTCDIAPWVSPSPNVGTGCQRFVFYVFELRKPLDRNDPELQCYRSDRTNFPLERFVRQYCTGRIYGTYITMQYCCDTNEYRDREDRYGGYDRYDGDDRYDGYDRYDGDDRYDGNDREERYRYSKYEN